MISIGKHKLDRCFVVAEAGVNHGGKLERAIELIDKAADAGADAVKFQTYRADKLVTKTAPRFWDYHEDEGKTQHEAYSELDKFDWKHYPRLLKECEKRGLEFLSTPFDFEAADYLDEIGMPAFKVASSDLTYLPYLKHIARKGKPILLSTGASTLGEIEEAVNAIMGEGNDQIVVMQCTLKYPTRPEDANLRIIETYKRLWPELEVGLSDHTLGTTAPALAVSLGAKVVEKHYTLDHDLKGNADHWLSVDPEQLEDMVIRIRETELMMGTGKKRVFGCEAETRKYDKRSIVSNKDIFRGQVIKRDDLICKRPGTGIEPKFMDILVGRIATQDIKKDTTITWKMI